MFESCLKKQKKILEEFSSTNSPQEVYEKILTLGKRQSKLSKEDKTAESKVQGCQSAMYLKSAYEEGKIYFSVEADALISAGLGILLVEVYSGETAEAILKCPPKYLEELQINETLSPGRANGLSSLFLRMKQEALQYYMQGQKQG